MTRFSGNRSKSGRSRSFNSSTQKRSSSKSSNKQSSQTAGVPQPKTGGIMSGIVGSLIGSAAGSMIGHSIMNDLAEEKTAPKECEDDLRLFMKCYNTKRDNLDFCEEFASNLQNCKDKYEE